MAAAVAFFVAAGVAFFVAAGFVDVPVPPSSPPPEEAA